MKIAKSRKPNETMRLKLILTIIVSVALASFNVAAQDEKPLNLAEVEKALRSTKATASAFLPPLPIMAC